jgi:hypothetical protein
VFSSITFQMLSQKAPIPSSPPLPYPPTPPSWPWCSPVLRHIKFVIPRGLSSQWWPIRPSSATYAARDTSGRDLILVYGFKGFSLCSVLTLNIMTSLCVVVKLFTSWCPREQRQIRHIPLQHMPQWHTLAGPYGQSFHYLPVTLSND